MVYSYRLVTKPQLHVGHSVVLDTFVAQLQHGAGLLKAQVRLVLQMMLSDKSCHEIQQCDHARGPALQLNPR